MYTHTHTHRPWLTHTILLNSRTHTAFSGHYSIMLMKQAESEAGSNPISAHKCTMPCDYYTRIIIHHLTLASTLWCMYYCTVQCALCSMHAFGSGISFPFIVPSNPKTRASVNMIADCAILFMDLSVLAKSAIFNFGKII